MHFPKSHLAFGIFLASFFYFVDADSSTDPSTLPTSSDTTVSASSSSSAPISSGTSIPVYANATTPSFNGSSATNSSATPSSSILPVDTSDSWWFPLVGLSDNSSLRWGVNVSHINPSRISGDASPDWNFEIAINNTNPVPTTTSGAYIGSQFILNFDGTAHKNGGLVVATNGDPTLVLGMNSTLNFTTSNSADDVVIPTVPFGINYGHNGVWNGSVTLGGRFDANRVASANWALIPESTNGNSTFLINGTQKLNVTLQAKGRSATFPAILDINSDALILPSSFNCSNIIIQSLIVSINSLDQVAPLLKVEVPANLTASPDRCVQLAPNVPNDNKVVLGRPFFQAAYVYVDTNGQVYLAAAHQYDLGIDAQVFNATATLLSAADATVQPSPAPTQNAAGSLRVIGSSTKAPFSAASISALLGLLAFIFAINI